MLAAFVTDWNTVGFPKLKRWKQYSLVEWTGLWPSLCRCLSGIAGTERLIEEYSDDLKATYESRPHRSIHQWLESHPVYDWLVAAYQNTHRSARQIEPFIKKHHIDMTEFKPVVYRSFAEFFDREFRPGARTFPQAADEMGAFAEARYFGWERLEDDQEFPLKGHSLSARRILGNEERARPFIGGPIILARLSPMDYHHVHYPDDGITLNRSGLATAYGR